MNLNLKHYTWNFLLKNNNYQIFIFYILKMESIGSFQKISALDFNK